MSTPASIEMNSVNVQSAFHFPASGRTIEYFYTNFLRELLILDVVSEGVWPTNFSSWWEQVDTKSRVLGFLRADSALCRLPARPPAHRAQTEGTASGRTGPQRNPAASSQRRLAAIHARPESFLGSPYDGVPPRNVHGEDAFYFACQGQVRRRIGKK